MREQLLTEQVNIMRDALIRIRGDFRDDALCSWSESCKHCIALAALVDVTAIENDYARTITDHLTPPR